MGASRGSSLSVGAPPCTFRVTSARPQRSRMKRSSLSGTCPASTTGRSSWGRSGAAWIGLPRGGPTQSGSGGGTTDTSLRTSMPLAFPPLVQNPFETLSRNNCDTSQLRECFDGCPRAECSNKLLFLVMGHLGCPPPPAPILAAWAVTPPPNGVKLRRGVKGEGGGRAHAAPGPTRTPRRPSRTPTCPGPAGRRRGPPRTSTPPAPSGPALAEESAARHTGDARGPNVAGGIVRGPWSGDFNCTVTGGMGF